MRYRGARPCSKGYDRAGAKAALRGASHDQEPVSRPRRKDGLTSSRTVIRMMHSCARVTWNPCPCSCDWRYSQRLLISDASHSQFLTHSTPAACGQRRQTVCAGASSRADGRPRLSWVSMQLLPSKAIVTATGGGSMYAKACVPVAHGDLAYSQLARAHWRVRTGARSLPCSGDSVACNGRGVAGGVREATSQR